MPVAVRHVESIIRMSEARASMRLSEHVSSEDIDAAIAVMLASFIGTQKMSVQKSLQKKFARYTHFHRDYDQLLLEILRGIVREMSYWAGDVLSFIHTIHFSSVLVHKTAKFLGRGSSLINVQALSLAQ